MKTIACSVCLAASLMLVAGIVDAQEKNPWAPSPDEPEEEPESPEPGDEWEEEDEVETEEPPPPAPSCPLVLELAPEGAFVILDGKIAGKTPLDDPVCPSAGTHSIVVQKDGHVSVSRTFEMSETEQTITITLTKKEDSGRLFVTSTFEGATLQIDGVDAGMLPWKGSVAPGPHDVKVLSAEGDVLKETNLLFLKGETKTMHVRPAEKKEGKLPKLHWAYMAGAGGLALAGGVTMLATAIVGKKHHDEYMNFRDEARAGTFEGDPVAKDKEYKDKGRALNGGLIAGMAALGVGIAAAAVLIPFTDFTPGKVEVQAGVGGGSVKVSF
jgi:hypothetical protein